MQRRFLFILSFFSILYCFSLSFLFPAFCFFLPHPHLRRAKQLPVEEVPLFEDFEDLPGLPRPRYEHFVQRRIKGSTDGLHALQAACREFHHELLLDCEHTLCPFAACVLLGYVLRRAHEAIHRGEEPAQERLHGELPELLALALESHLAVLEIRLSPRGDVLQFSLFFFSPIELLHQRCDFGFEFSTALLQR